jgi:hypothetical protein
MTLKVFAASDGTKYVRLDEIENTVLRMREQIEEQKAKIAELSIKPDEQDAYTQVREPVFENAASPNTRSTAPTENRGNLVKEGIPFEELYWGQRTALRSALLRLREYKIIDPAPFGQEQITDGKDTQKLTDQLESIFRNLLQQNDAKHLETLQNVRNERDAARREHERTASRYRHLLQRLENLFRGETQPAMTPERSIREALESMGRRDGRYLHSQRG